jgi:hypothetical protein
VTVLTAPVRVPSQRPLSQSVASFTSVANDKSDNELILGAVHRSPGNCLTAEENTRKRQLGNRLMKELATSHYLKWGPFLTNEVCRIAQHGTGRDISLAVHGVMGCSRKSFKLVWQCHQFLSEFIARGHLPRVLRRSCRLLMIRVIMK